MHAEQKNHKFSWLLIFVCCFSVEASAQNQPSIPDDAQIRGAANEIAQFFEINDPSLIRIENSLSSHFSQNVIISRTEIRNRLANVPQRNVPGIVRFIIAHEMWHKKQSQLYGLNIQNLTDQQRRHFECQADMMAAQYVARFLTLSVADATQASQIFSAVDNFAASLGGQSSDPSYPSGEQRRNAARLGGARALLDTREGQSSPENLEALRKLTNWRVNESAAAWSLRQCLRIIQHDAALIRAVSVESKSINWSTSPHAPFVFFRIIYRNLSQAPIQISTEIQSLSTLRNQPSNITDRLKIDVFNVEVELAPGGRYVAEGRMVWYATERLMPMISYLPSDAGSLISVQAVQAPPGSGGAASQSGAAFPRPAQNLGPEARQLFSVINRYMLPGAFTRYRIGPMEFNTFRTEVPLPGATESLIETNPGEVPSVFGEYYLGTSQEEATRVFERLSGYLSSIWPNIVRRSISRRGTANTTVELPNLLEIEVTNYRNESGRHRVYITIKPINIQ